jgi:DNA segregation ATPase FtsK/SpoIIIE-like protein
MYNGIPHLLSPVVTEVDKIVPVLKNAIAEMERRYRLFSQIGVRNLDGYRKLRAEKIAHGDESLKNLPAIVIIIDELADLMMAAPEEVEGMICRLAQLARATGIHLVVATQRPSVDVLTGLIKANFPTRIAFAVSSQTDSRVVLDQAGAEKLLGRGDSLFMPTDAMKPVRIQGAFVSDDEMADLVSHWKAQGGPRYTPEEIEQIQALGRGEDEDEEIYDKAVELAETVGRLSASLLQRRLGLGHARAQRLLDRLIEEGIAEG